MTWPSMADVVAPPSGRVRDLTPLRASESSQSGVLACGCQAGARYRGALQNRRCRDGSASSIDTREIETARREHALTGHRRLLPLLLPLQVHMDIRTTTRIRRSAISWPLGSAVAWCRSSQLRNPAPSSFA